jgi:hypothetical protein
MLVQQYVLTSAHCKASIPIDAVVLGAKRVGKDINIFVELDETRPVVLRTFIAVPTGAKFPPVLGIFIYIDTVQMDKVFWHIYELKEKLCEKK